MPRGSRILRDSALTLMVSLLISCSDINPLATPPEELLQVGSAPAESDLDKELRGLLQKHGAPGGVNYFRLPKSHQLGRIPQDPENQLTPAKVELGRLLYHETALGVNTVRPEGRETYACASCHFAQAGFMANLPQGIAEGGSGFGLAGEGRVALPQYDSDPHAPDVQPIRTPAVLNGAYQECMLWNGQFGGVGPNLGTEDRWTPGSPKESNHLGMHGLETQAHAGLAVHRMEDIAASRVASHPEYQRRFAKAFPGTANPVNRLNAALAIAAFERTLLATEAPFQRWLRGQHRAMSDQEKRGAILFFAKAECVGCHTGPALNSMTFFALGMKDIDGSWDPSRVNLDPTDGSVPEEVRLGRGGFTGRTDDHYTFKTPQLYNLVDSPFYGHGGSFATLREVVEYKNVAVPENPLVPPGQLAPEFRPLGLSAAEIDDLVSFLENALRDPDLMRYVPGALPSENCTPVNDPQGRNDLGCEPLMQGYP
jgi:cytochrome c peroxidase